MSRYKDEQCRICRREGQKLFLKGSRCYSDKCSVTRRNYAPGEHGQGKKKLSEYGTQLREKQKTRSFYGVGEKQFRKYFEMAENKKGITGENLLQILESRLDNVVYRAGFGVSRAQARQLVNHGHFEVNGQKVDIPSYLIKAGDVISVRENKLDNKTIKENVEANKTRPIPEWLEKDNNKLQVKVLRLAAREDVDIPVEEQTDWLNAYWNDVNDFHLLKNIKDAAVMIVNHCMWTSSKITILQDSDADGLTSSAIIANYIHRICSKEPTILIHEGKAHGLADIDLDKIVETTSLLIIPDAASNDYEQLKYLHDNGVDIVICDHHHCEKYSDDAIVVNNQLDDYPNKNFSGAGVTWQLCRQIDELLHFNYANDLVDLCALGLCGDMMDYHEKEVRALVNIGYSNVKNKFFKAFVDKQ